jgi:hypothetical protein
VIRYVLLHRRSVQYLESQDDFGRKTYTQDISKSQFFSDLKELAEGDLLKDHELIPVSITALA